MIDDLLWISGLVAWLTLAGIGLLMIGDWLIDWLVNSIWTKREFLAFVQDRLKKRYSRRPAS